MQKKKIHSEKFNESKQQKFVFKTKLNIKW